MVGHKRVNGVSLKTGESNNVSWTWTTPNTPDTYTVKAFAFDGNRELSLADQNAGSFVGYVPPSPTFSTSTAINPTQVSAGQQVQSRRRSPTRRRTAISETAVG